MTIREFCELSGVNYDMLVMKGEIVDAIKAHCRKRKISQRMLAAMVPGLTQDRVSKFYNSTTGGGITIDKLLEITSALKLRVKIAVTPSAA